MKCDYCHREIFDFKNYVTMLVNGRSWNYHLKCHMPNIKNDSYEM